LVFFKVFLGEVFAGICFWETGREAFFAGTEDLAEEVASEVTIGDL
jgi:hypothetical protein